jgi:hypothetical protein
MLMVKMTEDWRRALDNRQVVGVLFIDLKKAFDSVSHPILLNKLHGLGISGDIWSWIMDYLSNRTQITVVNGCHSKQMKVKFGVPQGSVLGPILFSIFCNDLPEIFCEDDDTELEMYANDTTLYVIGPTVDIVTFRLNEVLGKFYNWCTFNSLTPHPGKTEYMLIGKKKFIGPLRGIMLGDYCIKRVHSKRCLGMEVDDGSKMG